jgi:hypothetical protein
VARLNGGYDIVHPYAIMVPMLHRDDIREYQVKQVARNAFEVSVVPAGAGAPAAGEIEGSLLASLRSSRVEANLRFSVECVERIAPDPKSGKTRRIWSAIGAPTDL